MPIDTNQLLENFKKYLVLERSMNSEQVADHMRGAELLMLYLQLEEVLPL